MSLQKIKHAVISLKKEIVVLSLFLVSPLFLNAQTTQIPDSNFEMALNILNIDTNGMNGDILNTDAENVTVLSISNWDISDLTGIEAFVNIEELYCYENNIASLDLQNNPNLEVLVADGNNLTNVNLTNNQNLHTLNLGGNYNLSTLDISNNANLIGLSLDDNALTSLDLSNNTLLEELQVNSNQLNSLDLSNNTALISLGCSLNNLTALDVSNNTSLQFLGCYSNNLTQLDLSSNLALEQLFCDNNSITTLNLDLNNSIKTLSCGSNNISSLNIGSKNLLEYLDVSNNNISSLDISQTPRLTHILANGNNISSIDTSNTLDLFMFNFIDNALTSLDLSSNVLIKHILVSQNDLQYLDIRNGANNIIQSFDASQNPNLTCILVDNSAATLLSSWIVDALALFFDNDAACQTLSLKKDEITDASFFPNPAKDHITVITNGNNVSFKLYTTSGSLVLEQILNQQHNNVVLPSLQSGMYVASITNNSQSLTKKLIIR